MINVAGQNFHFVKPTVTLFFSSSINKTAKQWRDKNKNTKGNIRDYASLNELLVLSNVESYNAIMMETGISQANRMIELRQLARTQLMVLEKLNDTSV